MHTENYEEHWIASPLDHDYPLTEKQYRIFVKGFGADFDNRYEPISVDGWHYIYRSGWWLEKFRYVKQKDGLYHITEHYIKPPKLKVGESWLDEVIYNHAWEPPMFTANELKEITLGAKIKKHF